ncbi:hypothetical protein B9T35_09980 [Acinetobacter sp. ANC 3832]|nr:hypothetical protein B9T35_09980 [Acinetobacter sp. ANC 3832]
MLTEGKLIFSAHNNLTNLELYETLQKLNLGTIKEIAEFDDTIQINFDTDDLSLIFLKPADGDSEVVHFFMPNNLYAEYNLIDGWVV